MPRQYSELKWDSILIFLSGVIVFVIGLKPEFISLQARFALFAQEMLRYGPTFFPTTYQIPYPDYPATSTFAIYLVSLLPGKVTPFSAVLPTAVTSALILVVTYRIGAIQSRKWGLVAVLFLMSTYLFFSESRSISLDQYTSLAAVLCFYLVYSADVFGRPKRIWFVPLVLTASFSFRGPIGLIVPAAVVCSYYLWAKEFRKSILVCLMTLGLLIMCSVGLLAAAYIQAGAAFVEKVIDAQVAGRLARSRESNFFYWYYCLSSCAPCYLLAILVVVAWFKNIIRKDNDRYKLMGYLLSWVLIVLIGMSLPAAKKVRYILPVVPALCLVSSCLFVDLSPKRILAEIRKLLPGVCSILPLLGSFAAVFILTFGKYFGFQFDAYYLIALVLLVGLTVIAGTVNRRLRGYPYRDMALIAVAVAAFITVNVCIVEPVNLALEQTGPFVEKVKSLQNEHPGKIVFYQIGPDGDDIKFMANYERPIKPVFIKSPDELPTCRRDSYFIAGKQNFDYLPEDITKQVQLCFQGKIGHRDCVVFVFQNSKNNMADQMSLSLETTGVKLADK